MVHSKMTYVLTYLQVQQSDRLISRWTENTNLWYNSWKNFKPFWHNMEQERQTDRQTDDRHHM